MIKHNAFRLSLMVLGFVSLVAASYVGGESNTESREAANQTYEIADGKCELVTAGGARAMVDLTRLVIRIKGRGYFEDYDLEGLGLPPIDIVAGRFADGFYVLRIPKEMDPFEVADALGNSGDFEFIRFDIMCPQFSHSPPNDSLYQDEQWNLRKIGLPDAWEFSTGDSTVVVAIVGGGVDYSHEDLEQNIWYGTGYDFYDDDDDPYPEVPCSHATEMSGIVAAVSNNSRGVAGVAGGWGEEHGVHIMAMDAGHYDDFWMQCLTNTSAAAEAIDSAAVWGAKVISLSFGDDNELPVLEGAINRAVNDYDVVVVAAVGNNYDSDSLRIMSYPARYPNVISVGGADSSDGWWSTVWSGYSYKSQRGNAPDESLDVVAPADRVYSTHPEGWSVYGNYGNQMWMTSGASAHACGVVALIRSVNPSLKWWQVRDILRTMADKDIPEMGGRAYTDSLGFGRVNAADALMQAKYNGELIAGDACHIDNDTTWPTPGGKFSNVYVEDSVTVAAGATLTILPGTQVLFRPDEEAPVGITVEGRLIAETPWQGHPSGIVFKSAADDPSPGDWLGISTTPEAYVNLMDCTIQHAWQGLIIRTAVNASQTRSEVINGIFEDNELRHICVEGYAPEPWEVYPAWANIRDCIFDVTSPCGLHFFTSAESVTVWDCKINGCSSATYGIYVEPMETGEEWETTWAGPKLIRNDFDSFIAGSAVHLVGGTECIISGGTLNGKWGVICEDSSSVSIEDDPQRTEFEWCTVGIETRDEAEAVITGAYLDCHRGLYAKDQSKSIVRNTTFDVSWIAVDVGWQAEPDLGDVLETSPGMNTFLANYPCDGRHRRFVNAPYRDPYIGPVMAEMNWWDSDPPDADCMSPGTVDYSPWLSSDPNNAEAAGVVQIVLEGIPAGVGQNYPNPFRNATMISYAVPVSGARVTVRVFDVKGRLIRTLMDRPDEAGRHELGWNGLDDKGRAVASGVYFLRIDIGDEFSGTKKMILGR